MKKMIAIILACALILTAASLCTAAETILRGDADDDGEVAILDATYIQRYEAGISLPTPLNTKNADVDNDIDVTIIDATLVQRWLVGIAESYGIGETVVETVAETAGETVQPTKPSYDLPFIPK